MEDEVKLLQEIGLTEYQSKALVALLARSETTAPKISEISGVPITRIYTVLKTISEYLLTSPEGTRPKTYRAIDVESIVDRMFKKKERYLSELRSRKSEITTRLENIASSGKMYESRENLVWFVSGLENVLHKIAKLSQTAKRTICTISTPGDWLVGHSNLEIIVSWIEAVRKRKVESWEIQPAIHPKEYEDVKKALKLALGKVDKNEFRVNATEYFSKDTLRIGQISRKNAHFTMVIKDDDRAFIGLKHPYSATSEAGLLISDKSVVKGLRNYFHAHLWPEAISAKDNLRKAWFNAI